MPRYKLPDWEPQFFLRSPMYKPLWHLAQRFSAFQRWPALADYQQVLEAWPESIETLAGKPLKVVAQDGRPGCFEDHYAPRIYATGEIQTRTENWHDFFQYLTWFMFPKTKAVINSLHLPYAQKRIESGQALGSRSPIENMLSLFDEGGAILVASDESLLQLVRDFQWKKLFWQRRESFGKQIGCVTFGHAVYEKGLAPYLGMTANCVLLSCDESFFKFSNLKQLRWLDQRLAQLFKEETTLTQPKDLQPFPILGIPGWDLKNTDETYYDNSDYFRPGRRGKNTPAKPVGVSV